MRSKTRAKPEQNASITQQNYLPVSRFSRQFRSSSQVLLELLSREQNSVTPKRLNGHHLRRAMNAGRKAKLKNSRVPRAFCFPSEQNP
jgi:hypothetical protein